MSGSKLYINAHGDMPHFIGICIATKICHDRKYKILDGSWFKKKEYYKGEPDLCIETEEKGYKDGKHCTIKQRYVIEIETTPTNESIEKKSRQFKESVVGWELIICDMRNVKDRRSWEEIQTYLEGRIP